jgi:prepilin-type N-terminal cleavage/methylation domain-containing protein
MITLRTSNTGPQAVRGVTLIELMVVLTIFSIVMAGLYSAYSVQMKVGVKEYQLAESEMEFQIGKMVLQRDMAMAGYGILDDYSAATPTAFTPRVVAATDGNPDTLTMVGTALGRDSRATQAWSYTMILNPAVLTDFFPFSAPSPSFQNVQEDLRAGDFVIYMNPTTRTLLARPAGEENGTTARTWLFPFPPSGANPRPDPLAEGVVAFGIQSLPAATFAGTPYYTVDYTLDGPPLNSCAPGSWNLRRAENRNVPATSAPQPLFNCVLDFQVAFGVDSLLDDQLIDCWDNGGQTFVAGYPASVVRKRVRQVKAYILVQQGKRDTSYTAPVDIRVGDAGLTSCIGTGVGRTVTLTAAQRQYRWRVLALSVVPRNIR